MIDIIWQEPESDIFYFYGHQGDPIIDSALTAAQQCGEIVMNDMERRYYKHPNFDKDYLQNVPTGENTFNFDWEQEVVEKGPEF